MPLTFYPAYTPPGVYQEEVVALTIKGTPQKVKAVGSLQSVTRDKVAAGAVRQAAEKPKKEARDGRKA